MNPIKEAKFDAAMTQRSVVACFIDITKSYLHFKWCERQGHDFEDHSVATPDTGDIHLVCRRCGADYQTILY